MTDLQSLLTRTRATADQRAAANRDQYARLVRKAAEGKSDLSPEAVLRDLDKLGRDPAEFAADVEALAQRIEWGERRAAGIEGQARADRADADLVRLEGEWAQKVAALEAEHFALVAPVRAERATAEALVRAGQEAARQLGQTAPQEARDAITAAAKARGAQLDAVARLRAEGPACRNSLAQLDAKIAEVKQTPLRNTNPGDREIHYGLIKQELDVLRATKSQTEARLAALPGLVAEAEKELARLDAELRRAEELLFVP